MQGERRTYRAQRARFAMRGRRTRPRRRLVRDMVECVASVFWWRPQPNESHLTCGGPFEGANRYNIIDEADLASAWRGASTASIGTLQATRAAVSSSATWLGGLDLTGKAAVLKTAGRKPVQVRVLCPPFPSTMTRGIMPRRDYVAWPARIARAPPIHSETLACRPAST